MTQKRMEKIVKRRRRAQGFGALTGTLTVFAILGAIYGDDMKKEAKKIGDEAKKIASDVQDRIPEQAKNAISGAKEKMGL